MPRSVKELARRLSRVFWIAMAAVTVFFAIDVLLHQRGIAVKPPFGAYRFWGLALMILAVGSGIALPILMRTLFHGRAVRTKQVEWGQYQRLQVTLILLTLGASLSACLAYLFLVPKLHLYASVLAALYGIYSVVPSERKLAGEMRYYGLEEGS